MFGECVVMLSPCSADTGMNVRSSMSSLVANSVNSAQISSKRSRE